MEVINDFLSSFNEDTIPEIILAICIVTILYICSPFISYLIIKIFNFKKTSKDIKKNAFYIPLKSFFRILGVYSAFIFLKPTFNLNDNFINIITKLFKISVIITTAMGLAKSITKKSKFMRFLKDKSDKDIDDTATRFIVRFLRMLIYIVAIFMIITELGYNLNWLITGLGLGSVVVTLAAQDMIKSLLGGFIIFLDKPYKIGDYVIFREIQGTVEDINFRSTKIRTLENSIAQIPNSETCNDTVINISKIKKRRYDLNTEIVLDTDLSKINDLKNKILEYLNQNNNVIEDSSNIFLDEIKTNGLELKVYCYINVTEYREYLAVKEQINIAIMHILKENKVELAYNTQTIEIKHT